MTQKQIEDSRKRAAETMKRRYGDDVYEKMGKESGKRKTREDMRIMSLKYWHPDYFDDQGNLKEEYK